MYQTQDEEKDAEVKKFYEDVNDLAKKRYNEKQEGITHDEHVDLNELTDLEHVNREDNRIGAEKYEIKQKDEEVKTRQAEMKYFKEQGIEVPGFTDVEEKEDDIPDLEEVTEEERRLEEVEKSKEQKQKEWLDKIVAE